MPTIAPATSMPGHAVGSWVQFSDAHFWMALAASFALSAALTALATRYARRRDLHDLPGQRRSHSEPTPRGGGIGIALTAIGICLSAYALAPGASSLRLLVAIALVAVVGWIDDHRGLKILPRLAAHFAALLVLFSYWFPILLHGQADGDAQGLLVLIVVLLAGVVGGVWSINLHNFMDGTNGILALQSIFVFSALAVLIAAAGGTLHAWQLALFAAAAAGFLPFNFPRARIFLGDVGSGVLGLLIAVAVFWQLGTPHVAKASGLIACSAFLVDATCTLLSRMLRGRRWYRPHREHLYQWMTRSGMSHASVAIAYMTWNLCVVVPVLWWINRQPAGQDSTDGIIQALALYAAAVVLWFFGKRWCVRKVGAGGKQSRA